MGYTLDPDYARQFLDEEPLATALSRIDDALEQDDEAIRMEFAEDTYAWLMGLQLDEADVQEYDVSKATFYVDRDLPYLQEHAPSTDFSRIDRGGRTVDRDELMYSNGLLLNLRFNTEHDVSEEIDTAYDRITFATPVLYRTLK